MRGYDRRLTQDICRKIRYPKFSWQKKFIRQPVFLSSFDGILLINRNNDILQINPSFQALFGGDEPNCLIGKSLMEIVAPEYQDAVQSMLEIYDLVQMPVQPVELEIYNHCKELLPVYLWIAETAHQNGSLIQLGVRDISEWKNTQNQLTQANLELGDAYRETLQGWGRALDLRDHETEGHTQRVTNETVRLASALGLSVETIYNMRFGAMLHDIGKMAIPDSILLKPGSLNVDEWRVMKMHPIYARRMLSQINFLQKAITIPYYHHEKWDGSGYPDGLCKEKIPIEARVFAVIDVWDALLSNRPYRSGWPAEKVCQYIEDSRETHFDPEIAQVFLDL